MNVLTEDEHITLMSAVQTLERKANAELVVVLAQSSDGYRYIPTLWAAIAALVLPGLYLLFVDSVDASRVYTAQVTLFFGLLFLFQWPPVQHWIIPSSVMRERATRFAHEQFFAHGVHHTSNRCGAMVFISLMEHHVEIMVDRGLAGDVSDTYWQQTIESMTPLLAQGKTADACEVAIQSVAEKMVQLAPRTNELPVDNELPDHIIEL